MKYTIYKGTDKEFRCNSIKELAKHIGMSISNLQARLSDFKKDIAYKTIDEAIEYDIIELRRKNIKTVFKGTDKEFTGTKAEIANHFNIDYSFLSSCYAGSLEDKILKAIKRRDVVNLSDEETLDILKELFSNPGNEIKKNKIKAILKY